MFDVAFKKIGFEMQIRNIFCSRPFGWNIELGWNAVLFFAAIFLSLIVAYFLLKKDCLKKVDFPDFALSCLFAGLFGARLFYLLFSGGSGVDSLLGFFNPTVGGLSLFGGIVFGAVSGCVCCKIKKLPGLRFLDVSFLSLFLGMIFGHFSEFLAGGGIGTFNAGLLWGITVDLRGPFHPLFLYWMLASALGFVLLLVYLKFFRRGDGEVFSLAIMILGIVRAVTVNFETKPLFWFGINVSFILAVIVAVVGFLVFLLLRFGFIGAFRENRAEKAEKHEETYQDIYKPLLETIPQTYVADQETLNESLTGQKPSLLGEMSEINRDPAQDSEPDEENQMSEERKDG